MRSAFWDDHERDLHNPEYALAFARESQRIAAVDRLIGELDGVRALKRISKTQLANACGLGDAALRRLFSRRADANPTVETLESIAQQLGFRLTLEPLDEEMTRTPARQRGVQAAASH